MSGRFLFPILLALLVLAEATSLRAAEPPPAVALAAGQGIVDLGPVMRFARDEDQSFAELLSAQRQGALNPDFEQVAGGIVPYQPVWGVVQLVNSGPANQTETQTWFLVPEIYGVVALEAHLVRDGGALETLLDHSIRRAFVTAHYSGTRLRTEPFRLAPGERAYLVVRMTFGPVQDADFTLENEAEHQRITFQAGLSLASYYAFLIACIFFFFLFNLSMGSGLGVGFSVLLALGSGFVAYLDGFLFRFLYPTAPGWHLPIGLGILFSIAAAGFLLAGSSIRELGGLARLASGCRIVGVMALAGIPASIALPTEILAPISYVLTTAMLGALAAAALQWNRSVGSQLPVIRLLTLAAFIGAGSLLLMLFTGWGIAALPVGWVIKLFYAVIAFSIMGGLSLSLLDLRRAHEAAQRREIAALQKEAKTSRDLLEAERNYSRARDLADLRRHQLASASHDIRQPLTSLRMTLDAIARDQDPAIRDRLREAFNYMDDLSLAYLQDSRPDGPGPSLEAAAPPAVTDETAGEAFALSLLFGTIDQMFGQEAVSKGITLRTVDCSLETPVPALVLMRVVSNLVSNAVKYTREGRVLVGVRRGGRGARIVVADTGPGMDDDEIARFRTAYQKGERSEGEGLGLAICFKLAAEHRLELEVVSEPGKGSCFRLGIPVCGIGDRS